MSSSHNIKTCHKVTLKTAKRGFLKEPLSAYGKHAYWCAELEISKGWNSKPCSHLGLVNKS